MNMRYRKFLGIFLLVFLSPMVGAQDPATSKIDWDGYAQLRFMSNFGDMNTFSLRRLKFWLKPGPGFNEHWGFKVQAALTGTQNEKFTLQDAEAFYYTGNFRFNIGQFIPAYSLEQFQPDAVIPLTERAPVIKALIPDGSLGLRDLGMEGHIQNTAKTVETWLGVFNGYGINEYRAMNNGFLVTHKTAIHLFEGHVTTGYSVMYRKSSGLKIKALIPEDEAYSGPDFRYDLFALYRSPLLLVQAEYLTAELRDGKADGGYLLAMVVLGKSQLVTSFESYHDTALATVNEEAVHLGYNILVRQDKLKVMLDNRFLISGSTGPGRYTSTVQCQIFFK